MNRNRLIRVLFIVALVLPVLCFASFAGIAGDRVTETYAHMSDAVSATEHHGENHDSGGLPQLDFKWYSSQIFWLVLSFILLYFGLSRLTVPMVSKVITNREEHIKSDLDSAEKIFFEAEKIKHEYESNIAKSREDARAIIVEMEKSIKNNLSEKNREARKKAEQEITEAEKEISEAKQSAMSDIQRTAVDAAILAKDKVLGNAGGKIEPRDVEVIVKEIIISKAV